MTIYKNVYDALCNLEDTKENRAVLQRLAISESNNHEMANKIRQSIIEINHEKNNMLGEIGNRPLNVRQDVELSAKGVPESTNDSLADDEADMLRQLAIACLIEFRLKEQLTVSIPQAFLQALGNNPHTPDKAELDSNTQFKTHLTTYAAELGLTADQLKCLTNSMLLEEQRKVAVVTLIMAKITELAQRTEVMDQFHSIAEDEHKTAVVAQALADHSGVTEEAKRARAIILAFVEADFATKGHLDKRIIDAISNIADVTAREAIKGYFLDRDEDKFGPSDIPRLRAAIVLAKIKPPAVPTLEILKAIKAAQSISIEKVNEKEAMLSSVRPSQDFINKYNTRTMHTNDNGDDLQVAKMDAVPAGRFSVGYRSTLNDGLSSDGSGTEIAEYTADTTMGNTGSIQIESPILTGGALTERTAAALAEYMAKRGWKSINIGTMDASVMVDVHVEGEMRQIPFKTLVYLAATAVTDQGLLVRDGGKPLPGRNKPVDMVKYLEKVGETGNASAEKLVSELFKKDTTFSVVTRLKN